MIEEYKEGWQIAVDWIYERSVSLDLSKGYNPLGREVSAKMRLLSGSKANGFCEGLIWVIGKPIDEIKKRAIDKK